jgi:hypothetical protein
VKEEAKIVKFSQALLRRRWKRKWRSGERRISEKDEDTREIRER